MAHLSAWHVDAGCYQDPSVSPPCGISPGLLECPYSMAPVFLQSVWSKKQWGISCNIFYNLAWAVTHCHFCNVLLVTQVILTQGGRALYEEVRMAKCHLGSWLLQSVMMRKEWQSGFSEVDSSQKPPLKSPAQPIPWFQPHETLSK